MLENMTTEEKVIAGLTAVGIAALVFHKPTRNAVGLSDGKKKGASTKKINQELKKLTDMTIKFQNGEITFEQWEEQSKIFKKYLFSGGK